MPTTFDPEAGARISAALVKAIAEAQALASDGDMGSDFRDIVQHARELYDLLLEQLIAAEPTLGERAQGMATAMGNKLFELEALAEDSSHPTTLN
jgi:hypothetical protein